MLIRSVLFVNQLMWYGYSMLLGVMNALLCRTLWPFFNSYKFWYTICVDISSIKEYEIPYPKRQVMLIRSVLFVNCLMWYGCNMLLGVLIHPLVIA